MGERRKHIRLSESLKIIYEVIKPLNGHDSYMTKNISEGGICIPTNQRLEPGMILDLQIHSPKFLRPILATGQISWIEEAKKGEFKFLMGIKFIEIEPLDYDKIINYIRQRAREGIPPEIKEID